MGGPPENVPGCQIIHVAAPGTPVAELADSEALQAYGAYPGAAYVSTVFGVAREREEGGWELHPYFGALAPQDARDSMGGHFRRLTQTPGRPVTRQRTMSACGPRSGWTGKPSMR